MSFFLGIYSYAGTAVKIPEAFKKYKFSSNGNLSVYHEERGILEIKNTDGCLCAAKGFFYDKKTDGKNIYSSNGNYVSALYDINSDKLTLSRSIFGALPLYFYDDGKVFIFSTHIEYLREFTKNMTANAAALDSYLTHKAVTADKTAYKNIFSLKAGFKAVKIKDEAIKYERYETLNFKADKTKKFQTAAAELKSLISSSLNMILQENPETAVFLSGGLDSNIAASLAAKKGVNSVFSAKIDNTDFDESLYAAKAAKFYGLKYNEVYVGSFNYDDLFELAKVYEQPFADASAYPVYKLMKESSRHYKSFLTGDGADELFGGYLRYRAVKAASAVPGIIKKPLKFLGGIFDVKGGERNLFKYARRFTSALSSSVCDINAAWYAAFSDDEKRLLLTAKTDFSALDEYKSYCATKRPLDGIFNADINLQLTDCFSLKIFFPAEHFSIAVNSPFYNKEILDFSQSLPEKYKISLSSGKRILKEAFKNDLPDFVIKRRKRGFGIPLNGWFRKESKDLALDLLLSERSLSRNYFNPAYLKKILDDHMSFKDNNGQKIWALCMYEMWNRAFIDNKK